MSVTGPLGLWSFPLINRILELLAQYRVRIPASTAHLKATAENVERWQVLRDDRGRLKYIEVHREVKEA